MQWGVRAGTAFGCLLGSFSQCSLVVEISRRVVTDSALRMTCGWFCAFYAFWVCLRTFFHLYKFFVFSQKNTHCLRFVDEQTILYPKSFQLFIVQTTFVVVKLICLFNTQLKQTHCNCRHEWRWFFPGVDIPATLVWQRTNIFQTLRLCTVLVSQFAASRCLYKECKVGFEMGQTGGKRPTPFFVLNNLGWPSKFCTFSFQHEPIQTSLPHEPSRFTHPEVTDHSMDGLESQKSTKRCLWGYVYVV